MIVVSQVRERVLEPHLSSGDSPWDQTHESTAAIHHRVILNEEKIGLELVLRLTVNWGMPQSMKEMPTNPQDAIDECKHQTTN